MSSGPACCAGSPNELESLAENDRNPFLPSDARVAALTYRLGGNGLFEDTLDIMDLPLGPSSMTGQPGQSVTFTLRPGAPGVQFAYKPGVRYILDIAAANCNGESGLGQEKRELHVDACLRLQGRHLAHEFPQATAGFGPESTEVFQAPGA